MLVQAILEVDNVSFDLYRNKVPDGAYSRLNDAMIPSQVSDGSRGTAYALPDVDVRPGVIYYTNWRT